MKAHLFTPHPLTALIYLKRFLPIFIIPVMGSVYRYVIQGYRFSSSVFYVAVALAALFWGLKEVTCISVKVANNKFFVKTGFIFKSSWQVEIKKIIALHVDQTLLTYLLGGARIRIETSAGKQRKGADLDIYISKRDLPEMIDAITQHKPKKPHKCSVGQSLLLALSETSAKSGLLIFSTSVNYLGRFLGSKIDTLRLNRLVYEQHWERLLPPLLISVATLITAGIVISFIAAVIRHSSLSIDNGNDLIHLRQGIIKKSDIYIFKNNLGAIIEVSTPILALFGRKNICLNVVGWGNKQGAVPVLPAVKSGKPYTDEGIYVKSGRKALIRGARIPAIIILLLLALWGVLIWLLPQMQGLWAILFLSSAALSGYRLFIKLKGIKRAGAFAGKKVVALFAKRFTLYRFITTAKAIDCITIRQTLFDLNWGMCTLTFSLYDKRKSRFYAPYLNVDEATDFVGKI